MGLFEKQVGSGRVVPDGVTISTKKIGSGRGWGPVFGNIVDFLGVIWIITPDRVRSGPVFYGSCQVGSD